MTEANPWRRASPVALLFFAGKTIRLIVQNAWQALAPIIAVAFTHQGNLMDKAALVAGAFALFIIGTAILSYWFFRFRIDPDAVRIRQGVLKKKQLDIRFDRIQAVNTQQNPVFRVLNLVTVSFDTAGSTADEGQLPAVTRNFVDELRTRIAGGDAVTEAGEHDEVAAPLLRLDWRDMIRIGLADRRAFVVLALIGPFMEQIDDRIERAIANYVDDRITEVVELSVASGILIALAIVATVLIVFTLISIAAAFLRFHNFELWLDSRTLRSTGGLLTRHEHSLELGKIQTLVLRQGIVQSWQHRFSLAARQAVAGRQQGSARTFRIPLVTAEQAHDLRQRFLDPEAGRLSQDPRDSGFQPVSGRYSRTPILLVGLLPAVLCVVVFWPTPRVAVLAALAWLAVVSLGAWRHWRRAGYAVDADEIVCRSGLLGYRTVSLLMRKVQRVTLRQSRYQRRHGLASLRFYMASGRVQIPYIDVETARQLRDYVLYRVESTNLKWH